MTKDTSTLLARFSDPRDLLEAVKRQRVVRGNDAPAQALSEIGTLVGFKPGETIISQGAFEREAFLLLAGKVSITINGCPLPYGREAGDILGELSAINPELPRTATIEATEPVAALRIEHNELIDIGQKNPEVWRLLAVELSRKLEQRNRFIDTSNKSPRIFMISSRECIEIAEDIRLGLEHSFPNVVLWSDDRIFPPGNYPLEDLRREVALADFGIALGHPDDIRRSRKRQAGVPRDNVIFELGYFMSVLGRKRTFLLVPDYKKVELPSDFKGLAPLTYRQPDEAIGSSTALGPTVRRIVKHVTELGPRSKLEPAC